MVQLLKLRVGSKIVEGGKVYRVFKIEKKKINGSDEQVYHYKPFFEDPHNRSLMCSIPEGSLGDANIRIPISTKEAKEILQTLKKKTRLVKPLDALEAKEIIKENNAFKTSVILKKFCCLDKRTENGLKKSERDVFDDALEKLSEEIAVAQRVLPNTAKDRILQALG